MQVTELANGLVIPVQKKQPTEKPKPVPGLVKGEEQRKIIREALQTVVHQLHYEFGNFNRQPDLYEACLESICGTARVLVGPVEFEEYT